MNIVLANADSAFINQFDHLLSTSLSNPVFSDYDPNLFFATCESELIELSTKTTIHLLLIMVDQPEDKGFQLAKTAHTLDQKVPIIFVSTDAELVYDSFTYHPISFIRVQHLEEDYYKAMSLVEDFWSDTKHILHISSRDQINYIQMDDITFIEKEKNSNYVLIHTIIDSYRYRSSIKDLKQQLPTKQYIQLGQSLLVNKSFIRSISPNKLLLSTTQCIDIPSALTPAYVDELVFQMA